MSPSLVELDAVAVRLGNTPVLHDIHLSVAPGTVLGVMGPNGSGKTTLLRVLATLVLPAAGRGRVLGASLDSDERFAVRPSIGMLGHVPALFGELTLWENTQISARLLGLPPGSADRALDVAGLAGAARRRADACSFGMQRRTELARLFVSRPRLLLLDEPHAGLDAEALELVSALIDRTIEGGGAALVVSHDARRLEPLVDETVRLVEGRLKVASP